MNFHHNRLESRFTWLHRKQKGVLPEWIQETPNNRSNIVMSDRVTDLTHSLSSDEISVLSKGPKFRIGEQFNSNSLMEIRTSLCRFAYQYRWIQAIPNIDTNNDFILYPKQNVIHLPPSNEELDRILNRIKMKVEDVLRANQRRNVIPNVTNLELSTINHLKQKPLIYLPSDKGGEFCIIDETRYKELGFNHLSDTSIYQPVAHITPKTIETKVNFTWRRICDRRNLSLRIRKSYISNNTSLARFYHLIKTHKALTDLKVRPIVSCSGGPTEKISWLLSRILKPILKTVPAHLESSAQLIERLTNLDHSTFQQYPYPFSLDVVALYTSIPIRDAINNMMDVLRITNFQYGQLMNDDIEELLHSVMTNTYFQFYDKIYRQIKGLPMGSNVSPILAITFMDSLERRVLLNNPFVGFFSRYIDDIFCLGRNKETADNFKSLMDSQNSSIQFEMEYPTDDCNLALLDMKVTIDPERPPSFEFHKKKAKKDIFIHYRSAQPSLLKSSVIKNERIRINHRCSTEETTRKHNQQFDVLLTKNGYPQRFINESYSTSRQTNRRNGDVKYFHMKIPFISDRLNYQLKSIFLSENIHVRFHHNNKSLRTLLKKTSQIDRQCTTNCHFQHVCHNANVVYEIKCSTCYKIYIGSTIRRLHIRLQEHFRSNSSSVWRHIQCCLDDPPLTLQDKLVIKVLARDKDPINLRIKEALLIRQKRPQLNSREELSELDLLT
jgi:hypothetical protein